MNQAFIIQNHILLGVPKALCVKKENSRSWGRQPCQSSWGRGSINATWVEYYQLFRAIKLEESKFQVKHWMDPQLIPYGWGLFTEKDEVSPLCISSTSTRVRWRKTFPGDLGGAGGGGGDQGEEDTSWKSWPTFQASNTYRDREHWPSTIEASRGEMKVNCRQKSLDYKVSQKKSDEQIAAGSTVHQYSAPLATISTRLNYIIL